jgi:hypothetical protein
LNEEFSMKIVRLHVSIGVFSAVVVPPAASLLLLATVLLPTSTAWADPASAVPYFLALFFLFAVPVGYVYGALPALLAGALYSCALSAQPGLCRHTLVRAGLGAVCGGLTGGIWFHAVGAAGAYLYSVAEALVTAMFALCWTGGALAERYASTERTGRELVLQTRESHL